MTRNFLKIIALATTLVIWSGGSAISGPADQDEIAGWNLLFGNRLENSEGVFSEVLSKDSHNQPARRGLIISLVCQGKDEELEHQLHEYSKHATGTMYDYFLPEFVRQNSELSTGSFYKSLYEYAEDISKKPDLQVMDARLFRDLALGYAYLIGSDKKVEKLRDSLGRIREWAVIGPFDNTSGSGHRRDHLESLEPDSRSYPGKHGQTLNWFFPHWIGLDGSLTLANHFHRKSNTTAYVRTTIEIPAEGEFLLSLGYEGDVIFFLDGVPIHEGRRLNWSGEARQWLVSLAKGRHEVAAKISNGENSGKIACCIVNGDGSPIKDLKANPRAKVEPSGNGEPVIRTVGRSLLMGFDDPSSKPEDDQEYEFWLLERLVGDQDPQTVDLSKELISGNENSALFNLAAARFAGSLSNKSGSKVLLDRAMELAPNLAPAVLALASYHMEERRFDKALELADRILVLVPTCRQAIRIKLDCLGAENKPGAQADFAGEIVKRIPKDALGYHYQAVAAMSLGDFKGASQYRTREIELLSPGSRRIAEAVDTLEEEDYPETRNRLKKLIDLVPDQEVFWVTYIRTLIAITHYDEANFILHQAQGTFPQNLDLILLKSRFAESGFNLKGADSRRFFPKEGVELKEREFRRLFPQGRYVPGKRVIMEDVDVRNSYIRVFLDEEAANHLEDALVLEPGDFWIRNQIRKLRGQSDLRTYLDDVDVEEFLADHRSEPTDSGNNALILRDWRRRFVFDNQASLLDRFIAVEVLTQAGIEEWENHRVPYSPYLEDLSSVSGLTVKPDGTLVDADVIGPTVVFRQLEPGDVLVLRYQLLTHHLGSLAGQFWDHHVFAYDDPCLDSRFKLILPTETVPRHRVLNDPDGSRVTVSKSTIDADYHVMEWASQQISPARLEPYSPAARSSFPWVDVSTIDTWETVSQWYADLAQGQAQPVPLVIDAAKEITAGCETPESKISTVYDFVSSQITYEYVPLLQSALVPRPAGEVLISRFGDCKDKSTLMVAMLQAVGINDCSIGLTSAWGDSSSQFLPSPRFNHAIVCRRTPDGKDTWYDPTVTGGVAGQIPLALVGAPVLPAGPIPAELTMIEPAPDGMPERDSQFEVFLEGNGDARIKGKILFRSMDDVSRMRNLFTGSSRDEIEQFFLMKMARQYPGAKLESLEGGNQSDASEGFLVVTEFSIPGCFSVSGDILAGSIPSGEDLAENLGQIVAIQTRSRPLDQRPLATRRRTVVRIEIPNSFEILSLPDGQDSRIEGFTYRSEYGSSGSELIVERVIQIGSRIVDTESYPALKTAIDAAMRDMGMTLVLKRKG